MAIARDMDFSRPKGKARDAPARGRLSENSREFDLREAKAGSVSADELLRRRQQKRVREAVSEKTPEADTESLREQAPETEKRHTLHQHGTRYQQRFQEAAKAEEQAPSAPETQKKPSKLTFDADELPLQDQPDRKLTKARSRADRVAEKLEKAEKRQVAHALLDEAMRIYQARH